VQAENDPVSSKASNEIGQTSLELDDENILISFLSEGCMAARNVADRAEGVETRKIRK